MSEELEAIYTSFLNNQVSFIIDEALRETVRSYPRCQNYDAH